MNKASLEHLELWVLFKVALSQHAGDGDFNAAIRASGFEIKNMYFTDGTIRFGTATTYRPLIPYTILAGGYYCCMSYVVDEILEIRNAILTGNGTYSH